MIYVCPFCGFDLTKPLVDGITVCGHCSRVFDSCIYNRLLAGHWIIKHNSNIDFEKFKFFSGLSDAEAILVYAFVGDHCYDFDEFQKALKQLGIPSKIFMEASV
jgi:hypothetical protein